MCLHTAVALELSAGGCGPLDWTRNQLGRRPIRGASQDPPRRVFQSVSAQAGRLGYHPIVRRSGHHYNGPLHSGGLQGTGPRAHCQSVTGPRRRQLGSSASRLHCRTSPAPGPRPTRGAGQGGTRWAQGLHPRPGRRTVGHVTCTGRPGAGDQRAPRSGHRPLDFKLDSDLTGGPTQRGAPRSPRQPEDPEPGSASYLGPDSDGTHQADGLTATNGMTLLPVQTPTQVPPVTTQPPWGRDSASECFKSDPTGGTSRRDQGPQRILGPQPQHSNKPATPVKSRTPKLTQNRLTDHLTAN